MSADVLSVAGQKRLLDGATGAVMITVSIAILLAWSLEASSSAPTPAAVLLLLYAGAYAFAGRKAEALRSPRRMALATAGMHLSAVPILAAVWMLLGPSEFPLFPVVFALPVATAALVPVKAHPYTTAVLSTLSVAAVAVLSSPEALWYTGTRAPWLAPALDALSALLPELEGAGSAFPHGVPTLLAWVGICLFGLAMAVSSVGAMLPSIRARLRASSVSARQAVRLARDVLAAGHDPAAIVEPSDGRVVRANARLRDCVSALDGASTLAELIGLRDPDRLNSILPQGELPAVACRLADRTRVCRLTARPVRQGRRRLSLVSIQDRSEQFLIESAMDAVATPALVLDDEGRLLYANPAALRLFPGLEPARPARESLQPEGAPDGWWDPAPRRQHERVVTLGDHIYKARLASIAYPGRADRFTTVMLEPGRGR